MPEQLMMQLIGTGIAVFICALIILIRAIISKEHRAEWKLALFFFGLGCIPIMAVIFDFIYSKIK